jgi:hypothetical protein
MTTDGGATAGGPFEVFISFARPSGLSDARAVHRCFKGLGIKPFMDERDVSLGVMWDRQLRRAHRRAAVTLVVVSKDTPESPFQCTEINCAIGWAKPATSRHLLVPWRLDCAPADDEWPTGLAAFQGLLGASIPPDEVARRVVHAIGAMPNRCAAPDSESGNDDGVDPEVVAAAKAAFAAAVTREFGEAPRVLILLKQSLGLQAASTADVVAHLQNLPPMKGIAALQQVAPLTNSSEQGTLRAIAAALLAGGAATDVAGTWVHAAVATQGRRPERGILNGVVTPLAAGLLNASSVHLAPNPRLVPYEAGNEVVLEGTHIWSATSDLPVLKTKEAHELQALSLVGDDTNTHAALSNPAGLNAIGRVLDSGGAPRLQALDAQRKRARAVLAAERETMHPKRLLRLFVVWCDEWDQSSDRAYVSACATLFALFDRCAPPVFLLQDDSSADADQQRTVAAALRALF